MPEISAVAKWKGKVYLFSDENGQVQECGGVGDVAHLRGAPAGFLPAMDDVEAAAVDGQGNLWVCASQSTKKDGSRTKERERLVMLPGGGGPAAICEHLRDVVLAQSNTPPAVMAAGGRVTPELGGLNIEGIAMVPSPYRGEGDMMMVGLRAPLTGGLAGDALILQVQFPMRLLPGVGGSPGLSWWSLPLGGNGVRDMYWDGAIGRLLVLSGGVTDAGTSFGIHQVNLLTRGIERTRAVPKHTEAIIREGGRIACIPDSRDAVPVIDWVTWP